MAVVGRHTSYAGQHHHMFEVTDSRASQLVIEGCEEVVFVHPRLILGESKRSDKEWQNEIERAFTRGERSFIKRITERRSVGGRTIAALPDSPDAVAERLSCKPPSEAEQVGLALYIRGDMVEALENQLETIMQRICAHAGVELSQWKEETDLGGRYTAGPWQSSGTATAPNGGPERDRTQMPAGSWTAVRDARGSWRGQVFTLHHDLTSLEKFFTEGHSANLTTTYGNLQCRMAPHWSIARRLNAAHAVRRSN